MYRFEKLRVYNHAMELISIIYKITKLLPKEEEFVLTSQLKRAVISIVLNIAEGSGGLGDKEYQSFLRISLKSLYETVAGLLIAKRLYNINVSDGLEKCDEVGKELHALINTLKKTNS
jgi:four helix bundle protein